MPSSIEDDEDSKGDILFLERLLHDPIPLSDTLDFSYEVKTFLLFFTYPVTSPLLLSSGSENKIFDPGITIIHFYSFQPGLSHRHGAFKKFNTHRSNLNEWPMKSMKRTLLSWMFSYSISIPLDQFKYGGNWVKLSDLKQVLRGRHPMLISSLIFFLVVNSSACCVLFLCGNPFCLFCCDLLSSIPGNLKTLAKGFYPPCLKFLSFNWESCILILSTNVLSFGILHKWP
nr:hypothetical protein [Tanacetum cinerariifolium]